MAIILDEENKVVTVENQPDAPRALFKNLPEASTIESGVGDVLINGVSIVDEHGDADIPVMASNEYGVAKINSTLGIAIANGNLAVVQSYLSNIKAGVDQYRPIVPLHQHESVFYGLSTAAGDTTQVLSDNAVGNYTDEAKIAIQKMLGLYDAPFRVIAERTIESSTGYIFINADDNNNPFSLSEVVVLYEAVVSDGTNGLGSVAFNNGIVITGASAPYITIASIYGNTAQTGVVHAVIRGGKLFGESARYTNEYATASVGNNLNASGIRNCEKITELCIGSVNGYNLTSGKITVFGR